MDGGVDCRKTSFPPCRLNHPHRHARHDDSRRDGKKKRPLAVQKVRLSPEQKQLLIEAPPQALPKGRESHREVPLWVYLRGEGTNLLYTICLILFVFLMCNVEIRVLVFLILLGWSVLIVASHIMRGIWSMG